MFSCTPEDDQSSSKHVKIMKNCVKNMILTFVGFPCVNCFYECTDVNNFKIE